MKKSEIEISVDQLNLNRATRNLLKRSNIPTLWDLRRIYEDGKLRHIRNLGMVKYKEIVDLLSSMSPGDITESALRWPYLHSKGYFIPKEIDDISIRDMKLSTRLRNGLGREGYKTVGSVMRMKRNEIYRLRNIGNVSIDELLQAIAKIEKEGLKYFEIPQPSSVAINYDTKRTIDAITARNLVDNYGLKTKYIAEWYGITVSRIGDIIRNKDYINRGNWLNKKLERSDIMHINSMIYENTDYYKSYKDKKFYLLTNRKDDCAAVIVDENEIKCFYLKTLPEKLQQRIREERRDSLTVDEIRIKSEGKIVTILKKEYFKPKKQNKFAYQAKLRGMTSDDYSIFLTGLPIIKNQYAVTDDRIIDFLRVHYKNGKITGAAGPEGQWFRSFIYRHGYKVKDIAELYGL